MTTYNHLPSAALVALDLELAKQFFAIRVDAERLSFVRQLAAEARAPALILDQTWPTLQRLLMHHDETSSEPVDSAALGMALAGGRLLHENADSLVTLLRPDLVPIVADALRAISFQRLGELRRDELAANPEPGHISATAELQPLRALAENVLQFYQQAKQSAAAVTFAAWSSDAAT